MFFKCENCEFELFNPIAETATTYLGLYDDARFPGRSILMLKNHYDNIEDVPTRISYTYLDEIKSTITVMKKVLNVERVNMSILGNTVSHVHAHLIPRYPDQEQFPHKSPWNDLRPQSTLNPSIKTSIIKSLQQHLS